ncbi:PREDICTED: plectin-like, partial [Priapulus caudatus]|uniref:Plectin-like n=1 Tax=Priapulus caudatus TaxID=37621 RepID=A0ABM1F8S7_PRICU
MASNMASPRHYYDNRVRTKSIEDVKLAQVMQVKSQERWDDGKPLSILALDPADRAVLKIADERDAIQKKTFTKWVNKHLAKHWHYVQRRTEVTDLFEGLRDGRNLISLLEVLSGELLPRERGRMRFHKLQNVQTVLDFLRFRGIKIVNIRPDDIVDGNPKLTLGLIWTIILHFQISDITVSGEQSLTSHDALLTWSQRTVAGYPGVKVNNFSESWRDGLAFAALLHRNRPDLLDFKELKSMPPRKRLHVAFTIAEQQFGVTKLLDPEDVDVARPDDKSLITYISSLYNVFPDIPPPQYSLQEAERQAKYDEYRELAHYIQRWNKEATAMMVDRNFPNALPDMKKLLQEFNKFKAEDIPQRLKDIRKLDILHKELDAMGPGNAGQYEVESELKFSVINRSWNRLMVYTQEREMSLHHEISRLERMQRLGDKVQRDMRQTTDRLDTIEKKLKEEETRMD